MGGFIFFTETGYMEKPWVFSPAHNIINLSNLGISQSTFATTGSVFTSVSRQ